MTNNKKPPDKYKCIKIPLKKILKDKDDSHVISDAALRTHKIIVKAYQLVRLWILTKFHNNEIIPTITRETFATAFRSIKLKSRGKKSELLQEFDILFSFEKEDASQLTQVLEQYVSIEMLTAFENNIKLHFFDSVRRYINSYWKNVFKDDIEQKRITMKSFYRELSILKRDIFEGTKNCDTKYHNWLDGNRFKIVPQVYKESYYYDVAASPQKYLYHMIWMNTELEKIQGKMFQFFPLRNNIVRGFIHLDNTTIINLLVDKSQKMSFKRDISGLEKVLWNSFFKTNIINKIKMKDYSFDYAFMTDGYNASLRFVHIDEFMKKNGLKESKRQGRQKTKGMTKQDRKERQDKITNDYETKKQENIKEKEENEKKKGKEKKSKKSNIEFPYIDEVDIRLLKNVNYVVVDPGKRDLMTMMNNKGETLTYSNSQRIKETKRFKYQRLLHNHRDELGILPIEKGLNGLNCKTTNIDLFKFYIKEKNKINSKLYPLYNSNNNIFPKYKWYAFINKQRCEDKMLNLIEGKFGKDVNIIYGDWSQGKQMRYFMSTPNLGIKRKLTERFNVYNIDEYRTSKLHYLTEKRCDNIKLTDQDGKTRKKHAILTYQMENKSLGCINRDKNACKNLLKIYEAYLNSNGKEDRLINFRRSVKTSNHQLKDSNLIRKLFLDCKWSNGVMLNSANVGKSA